MAPAIFLFAAWLLARGKFDDWLQLALEDKATIEGAVTTTSNPTVERTLGVTGSIVSDVLDSVWDSEYSEWLQ